MTLEVLRGYPQVLFTQHLPTPSFLPKSVTLPDLVMAIPQIVHGWCPFTKFTILYSLVEASPL